MDIKLIQWNGQSVKAHKPFLEMYLGTHSPQIAILAETWLKATHSFNFKNYYSVRSDRIDGYGGSAILISKNLNFQIINTDNLSNNYVQVCGVKINIGNFNLDVISVYVKPTYTLRNSFWQTLLSKLSSKYLICGDFNAHSEVWGC